MTITTRLLAALGTTAFVGMHLAAQSAGGYRATQETVGHKTGSNRVVTPVNQTLTPLGKQVDLPGMRPQALAMSPDGKVLVTSGKTSELVVLDPATGEIVQKVAFPNEGLNEPQPAAPTSNILKPDTEGLISFTGLAFSPDGGRIYLSNVKGSIKVFSVAGDGRVTPSHSIPLPLANAPRRKEEIPTGLALSSDGARLYVCANLSNQLFEIDTATGRLLRKFPVGVAPFDVVLVKGRAYVSNWADGARVQGI